MKKIRLLLTAGLVGLLTLLPTSAFADIVDDISQEYGYAYRWTVEAELDETYDGTWLGDMADDGKIRVSFIATEEPLVDGFDADRGVIIIQGNDEIVLGVKAYSVGNNASYSTYSAPNQLVKEDGEWVVKDITLGEGSTEGFSVGVYATGDEKIEKRFLAIHPGRREQARNGNAKSVVTIIGLDADGLDKAEDTELSLLERKKYYIKYMGNRTPASYSESGEVIWAKPIIRDDKKSPAVDSDYFLDDEEPEEPEDSKDVEEPEENKIVYAPEKKIPDFAITIKEMENAAIRKVNTDVVGDGFGYGTTILNGRGLGSAYHQSIQSGKASFNITLPKEKVADISSNGDIIVNLQKYEVYKTSLADMDLVFEPYDSVPENADEIVISLKGDLGEKAYFLEGSSDEYSENGVYSVHYRLYEIFEINEEIIAYISHKRVPKQDGIGGLVDKNDENYIFTPIKDTILYCQFADSAYCGVEKIGFKLGDDICTVDIDDTKMDFDVEVDLSDRIIGTKAARKLLAEIRAERNKNSEVVNVLENGKPDFNTNIVPEKPEEAPEMPEEIPEAPVVPSDEIRVDLRGKFLEFADQKPIIENSRVLVPFRVIFEALEADVLWDGDTRTVTATKGDITISLTIGDNKIVKNGEVIEIDVPAQIQNSRTLVPIRVVSESFENTVSWDGTNRIVEIK